MKESYFHKLNFLALMHDFAVVLLDTPGLIENEVHISGHAGLSLFLCRLDFGGLSASLWGNNGPAGFRSLFDFGAHPS